MERSLWFLDSDQRNWRFGRSSEALEQGNKHTERSQSSVRHVLREETPRVLIPGDDLSGFQGFFGAQYLPVNVLDARYDATDILLDLYLHLRVVTFNPGQDAGQVPAISQQKVSRIWLLKIS